MKQTRPVRELCTLRASSQMANVPGLYHPKVRLTAPRPTDTDTVSGARVLRVLSEDSFSHNSPKPQSSSLQFSSLRASATRRACERSARAAPTF
eukprot:scaffold15098_cov70-Phaeocystis_antarctica.AAC.3